MIRQCRDDEFETIFEIINDAAQAYEGVIPADRYHVPYMPREELRDEIAAGVRFYGVQEGDTLAGVMGVQDVKDVTLIRHAYTRTLDQRKGIGARLLAELKAKARRPMLVGTWAAATWAIRFYERHGFELVPEAEIASLLRHYWSIPARQVETSVVLAEQGWHWAGSK